MLKSITPKRPSKDQRERLVLLGLIELYLESGTPIGSNTLKENGFKNLSSATIRNYFSKLENEGYLEQVHASGGRIPTEQALRLYAQLHLNDADFDKKLDRFLKDQLKQNTRAIAKYLQQATELLAEASSCAVFLSAPRFDQDFVADIKLLPIDHERCLCAIITDFGLVHTELLSIDKPLKEKAVKNIESHLKWRLQATERPNLSADEEKLSTEFYNELMLRHIVRHSNFQVEDLHKAGFSNLLHYPDFNDPSSLANGLSLFENPQELRTLLRHCIHNQRLTYWIGSDLNFIAPTLKECAIIAVPYKINQTTVGALAVLGPKRLPYRKLFPLLKRAADLISESLTQSLYKFKMTYRQAQMRVVDFKESPEHVHSQAECLLLDNKKDN